MDENITSNEFNVTLEGGMDQIDVKTVTRTLQDFDSLVNSINYELGYSIEIELKIKPFRKGSFEILFFLADPNLTQSIVQFLGLSKDIITTLVGIFNLKKFLKGEKPSKITNLNDESILVEDLSENKLTVGINAGNLYQNSPTINHCVNNIFLTIEKNKDIKSLKIKDSRNIELVDIPVEEFTAMSNENQILLEEKTRIRIKKDKNAILGIYKIIFKENTKWELFYKGFKINVSIEDRDFFEKIKRDEVSFSIGVQLEVELNITQEYDSKAKVYVNKSYAIEKVKRIIHQGEQGDLQFEQSL